MTIARVLQAVRSKRSAAASLAALSLGAGITFSAQALEMEISNVAFYNDHYGINRFFLGGGGTLAAFRAEVTPSPDTGLPLGAGTVVTVDHDFLPSVFKPLPLSYNGPTHSPADGVIGGAGTANSYYGGLLQKTVKDFPVYEQDWTMSASNPGVNGGAPATLDLTTEGFVLDTDLTPSEVEDMKISGDPATPTFNWTIPDGSLHNVVSVAIWRTDVPAVDEGGLPQFVYGDFLPPDLREFTVPGAEALDPEGHYMLGVQLDIFDEDADGNPVPSFSALRGRSRTFHEFSPDAATAGGDVVLPSVDSEGVFHFDVAVVKGVEILIDPFVAIGYDYEVGAGDRLFNSFTLPEIGDNLFDLYLFDDLLGEFVFEGVVEAGFEYVFDTAVSLFRILGIEVGAGLDPANPTAFVTGLTFDGDGRFTGTMTPISVFVPEPGALALLATGLGLLRLRRRSIS